MAWNRLENHSQHLKPGSHRQISLHPHCWVHLWTTQIVQLRLRRGPTRDHLRRGSHRTQRLPPINCRNSLQSSERRTSFNGKGCSEQPVQVIHVFTARIGHKQRNLRRVQYPGYPWVLQKLLQPPPRALLQHHRRSHFPHPQQHSKRKYLYYCYGVVERLGTLVKKYWIESFVE